MMTPWVFSGASLFALLIVDICGVPVKKGFNPSAATSFGSNQGAPSGQFSPGSVPNYAPASGVAMPSYQPVPEPSFSQPAVQRQPAAPRPVQPAYRGSSVSQNPASSTQAGTLQPAFQAFNWAVAPPTPYSGGEEMAAGTRVGSSGPENVSPPLPPPGPVYQGGELSYYQQSLENGDSEMETEEQGYLPPPPMVESVGSGFTSQPVSLPSPNGIWGPYPEYVYMFLTGQLPQGTITHSSRSYEQGNDHWQDVHYERYYYPESASPAQQLETFTSDVAAPQSFEDPSQSMKNPSNTGYAPAVHEASRGDFRQPTYSQASNYMKVGY